MKADYLQLEQEGMTKHLSSRYTQIYLIALLSIVLICAVAWTTRSFVEQQIRNSAANLLSTHKQSINNTVERLRHLPISASLDPSIISLLENGMTQTSSNTVSRYLATIAQSANASLYYVIDVDGNTVASSNWQKDNSLVGKNYSFRPYFQDAMKGQNSRYFAIGIATREAGYYFASPVTNEQGIIGVVVVKNELESMQAQWQKTGHNLLLIDENNVSVLASNDSWRFKTLPDGESENLPNLMDKLKYAGQELTPLVNTKNLQSNEIQLDNTRYLITTEHLDNQGWQLWKLTSSDSLRTATWLSIIATLLLICLSTALYLYRREKGRKNMLAAEAREAQTMRTLNRQLEQEIAERHKTQMELNTAQDELMQASKLAALGQMSAAIVHEVNQPLAAIKTYGASTKLLIDRGQMPAAIENLDKIGTLTE